MPPKCNHELGARKHFMPAELASIPIAEAGLEVVTSNHLEAAGICTVADLLQLTERNLAKIPNIGAERAQRLAKLLKITGYPLRRNQ